VIYKLDFSESDTIEVDTTTAGLLSTVVPIMFRRNRFDLTLEGTAFCVGTLTNGEAIFVTARHVVAKLAETETIQSAYIMLPRSGQPWSALNVHAVPFRVLSTADTHSDVAAFVVDVNGDPQTQGLEIKTLPVNVSRPVVGSKFVGFGYPQKTGTLSFTMLAGQGNIEEVHPRMRDISFVTWPSFRMDADFDFGTSGGPVLDEDGNVIGVVSTSSHGFGYAALIAGAMELKLDLRGVGGQLGELSIKDLMTMDVIAATGRATLDRTADGVAIEWP
jgi:S1-C subfamily serine protease